MLHVKRDLAQAPVQQQLTAYCLKQTVAGWVQLDLALFPMGVRGVWSRATAGCRGATEGS